MDEINLKFKDRHHLRTQQRVNTSLGMPGTGRGTGSRRNRFTCYQNHPNTLTIGVTLSSKVSSIHSNPIAPCSQVPKMNSSL